MTLASGGGESDVPASNPPVTCIQFPVFFFKKESILIISPIISFQILIFEWETFQISLSLTRSNILLLCVLYSNSTCMVDISLYIYTHNLLSMFSDGYISDVIQVQYHYVCKGKLMGGGET